MLRMVTAILKLDPPPETDHAADALAVAVCHATRTPASARLAAAG
jgi:Holliday junction resolvasome RuvABC endonuclease subunit